MCNKDYSLSLMVSSDGEVNNVKAVVSGWMNKISLSVSVMACCIYRVVISFVIKMKSITNDFKIPPLQ